EIPGVGPRRALRVYKDLWQGGVRAVEDLGVTREVRQRIAEVGRISSLELERELRSADGTIKFLWRLEDGHTIESVLIPDGERVTLCMSSQVGCAMACTFCLTGDLGL